MTENQWENKETKKTNENQGEILQIQQKVRKCWKTNEKLRKTNGKQQKIKTIKENQ